MGTYITVMIGAIILGAKLMNDRATDQGLSDRIRIRRVVGVIAILVGLSTLTVVAIYIGAGAS